ncbi:MULTISPECIES: sirohydrochlorin chelatase [unclassified Streptomyces]|uniref:sirohydrochlorin chelatase n=1 Tax=unclassified Streptomyces TaxID=2593676 RepID=UPI0033DE3CA3
MSSPTGPANGLPVRMPRPRQTGRHRRPEPAVAPEGAPALVLAVPGAPSAASRGLAEEIISIGRSELPGLEARIGFLEGEGDEGAEFPSLSTVLTAVAGERVARAEFARAAGHEVPEPTGPDAVVVPLLAGPDADLLRRIRQAVMDSSAAVELAEVLGPHPLLAEGLHVRLSEAGLARADRARLFTVTTAADGIIVATTGGEEAVQVAGVTGMLLAARLAVPVKAAALDQEGSVAAVAEQLRSEGSTQLALAPYLIGPEAAEGLLDTAAKEADCAAAEVLGAYGALGKLVVTQYAAAVGISQGASAAR